MGSTLTQVTNAVGTEKFTVLAAAVDRVIDDQKMINGEIGIDDEIETLDLDNLAEKYGATATTLRRQIRRTLGTEGAFKFGKKWVVRKRTFL